MSNAINIVAIVESVEKTNSGYERAIKKLAERPFTSSFTSADVDISGSTLYWLSRYGVLKVVGTREEFICVDKYNETYKKVSVNIYSVDCDIIELARAFEEKKKEVKVAKIEQRIARLKASLADALADLEAIQ